MRQLVGYREVFLARCGSQGLYTRGISVYDHIQEFRRDFDTQFIITEKQPKKSGFLHHLISKFTKNITLPEFSVIKAYPILIRFWAETTPKQTWRPPQYDRTVE